MFREAFKISAMLFFTHSMIKLVRMAGDNDFLMHYLQYCLSSSITLDPDELIGNQIVSQQQTIPPMSNTFGERQPLQYAEHSDYIHQNLEPLDRNIFLQNLIGLLALENRNPASELQHSSTDGSEDKTVHTFKTLYYANFFDDYEIQTQPLTDFKDIEPQNLDSCGPFQSEIKPTFYKEDDSGYSISSGNESFDFSALQDILRTSSISKLAEHLELSSNVVQVTAEPFNAPLGHDFDTNSRSGSYTPNNEFSVRLNAHFNEKTENFNAMLNDVEAQKIINRKGKLDYLQMRRITVEQIFKFGRFKDERFIEEYIKSFSMAYKGIKINYYYLLLHPLIRKLRLHNNSYFFIEKIEPFGFVIKHLTENHLNFLHTCVSNNLISPSSFISLLYYIRCNVKFEINNRTRKDLLYKFQIAFKDLYTNFIEKIKSITGPNLDKYDKNTIEEIIFQFQKIFFKNNEKVTYHIGYIFEIISLFSIFNDRITNNFEIEIAKHLITYFLNSADCHKKYSGKLRPLIEFNDWQFKIKNKSFCTAKVIFDLLKEWNKKQLLLESLMP